MNYEKLYKEAIKRAKKNFKTAQDLCEGSKISVECFKNTLTNIFPELKEREGDKMLQEIKRYIKEQGDKPTGLPNGSVAVDDMLAWLEKQNEQKYTQRDIDDAYLKGIADTKREVEKESEKDKKIRADIANFIFKSQENIKDRAKWIKYLGYTPTFVGDKQKPADNVGSKFKVGDWIVHHGTENIYQVVAVIDNQYQLKYGDTYTIQKYADVDKNARLWDISKDAKDGDVLACSINKVEIGGNIEKLPNITPTICIYQNVVKDKDYIHTYCSLYNGSSLVLSNSMYYDAFVYNIHPATKEQCDTLMKAMADAGWEFDFEKKELKKIHVIDDSKAEMDYCFTKMMNSEKVSPAWSEEDEEMINNIIDYIKPMPIFLISTTGKSGKEYTKEFIKQAITWLESLKERYTNILFKLNIVKTINQINNTMK